MSKQENEQDYEQEYDLITLVDDEGNEHEFEVIDSITHNDTDYRALLPIFEGAEDLLQDSDELVIMRISEEDGEFYLDTVDDDDEYDEISAIFVERLTDDFDILEEFDSELDE